MKKSYINRSSKLAMVLAILATLAACATNPVTGKKEVVLMSEEQEIAMGTQHHEKSILKQYQIYEHPKLQQYVSELGQKLAAKSHRSNLPFKFTLLDSPQVNAFALPGGFVYITRGIMSYMNSEEELAGVLGHEIGHVTARHSVRQHRSQTLTGLGGMLATIATGNAQVAQAANQLTTAWVRGYGRSHELEADRLGAEYLARTDYDPEKMLEVVGILKDQEEFELQRAKEEGRQPRVYHGVFSTHPRNDQRLQEVIKAAGRFSNADAVQTDPEEFLKLMQGVTFGHNETQGILRKNKFYHKPLDFTLTFPEGWRIENQPDQLVAIRPDGNVAMIVKIDKLQNGESSSQFLQRKFANLSNGRHINGGGYTGITKGKHPFGEGAFRVTSVPHNGGVFVVAGFAKADRPDQLFVDTAASIRKLKRSEIKLASSQKIKLVRARSGDTFAQLARQVDLGDYAEEQLRLLNGMYPDGEPSVGQLIKIIE